MKKRIVALIMICCFGLCGCKGGESVTEGQSVDPVNGTVVQQDEDKIVEEPGDEERISDVESALEYLELVLNADNVDKLKSAQSDFESYATVVSFNEKKFYDLSDEETEKLYEARKAYFEGEIISLAKLYESEISPEEFQKEVSVDGDWYKTFIAGDLDDGFETQIEERWGIFDSLEWFTQAKFAADIAKEYMDEQSAMSLMNVLGCYMSYNDAIEKAYEKAQGDLGLDEDTIAKANAARSALCAIQLIKILYDLDPSDNYWMD